MSILKREPCVQKNQTRFQDSLGGGEAATFGRKVTNQGSGSWLMCCLSPTEGAAGLGKGQEGPTRLLEALA